MPDSMKQRGTAADHRPRGLTQDFWHKIQLWCHAVAVEPFYRYGEIGSILFNIGKSILEGAILYTMFSMAETEYKVAAIMGVMTKYIYPGIVVVSNAKVSSFIDYLETFTSKFHQVQRLIRGLVIVGVGEALGAIFLVLCYPPFFEMIFDSFDHRRYILIGLYLFHHITSGCAQVIEGRIWFRLIEIKIRSRQTAHLAGNFWGIHAMSQNIHLIISMMLLWGTTAISGFYNQALDGNLMLTIVTLGLILALPSKFILPLAWRLRLHKQELQRNE